MENINSLIKKKGAIKGIYLGIILLAFNLCLYYFVTKITDSFFMIAIGSNMLLLAMEIAVTVFFCNRLRYQIGGYWDLRQSVTGIFLMFIVAFAIQFVSYDIVFKKLVDKDVDLNIHNAWQSANLKTLKQGADPRLVQSRQGKIDSNFQEQQKSGSVKYIIMDIAITVILVFVAALIFAALFKRNPPLKTS